MVVFFFFCFRGGPLFFFLPVDSVRAAILAGHLDMAAVSIAREGLRGLSIKVDSRVPIARWCGNPPDAQFFATSSPKTEENCYLFDAHGFVYATTSTEILTRSFVVYESLALQSASTTALGMTLPHADTFPVVFDFARQLSSFGSPVTAIVFHDGEVDQYLENGVRVSYVMGNEQHALNALAFARPDLRADRKFPQHRDLWACV